MAAPQIALFLYAPLLKERDVAITRAVRSQEEEVLAIV
jgi:hypothetical protein